MTTTRRTPQCSRRGGTTAAPASRPSSAIPVSQMNTAAAASVASASGKSKDIRSPHTEPVTEPEDGASRHHRLLSRGAQLRGRPCLQSPPAAGPNSDRNQAHSSASVKNTPGKMRHDAGRIARTPQDFAVPLRNHGPVLPSDGGFSLSRLPRSHTSVSNNVGAAYSVRDWYSCRH